MKRFIKSINSTAVFVICACIVLSVIQTAYGKKEFTAGEYTDYYYLTLTETEKQAYTAVKENIYSFPEKIETPVMDKVQLEAVINALIYDNPMMFMLSTCTLQIKGERAYFVPDYTITQSEYDTQCARINQKIAQIKNSLPADSFEAELYCHDYIINTCTYSDTDNHAESTVAGVLLNGKAKCSGYAKTLKLLLDSAGIESVLVTGDSTDYNGKTQSHMWNAVKIDNRWCYTDTTWDDPVDKSGKEYVEHVYFNMTEEMLRRTHKEFDFAYECNTPALYYYIIYGAYFSQADRDMLTAVSSLISTAATHGKKSIDIMFASDSVTDDAQKYLFDKEKIYRALETAALDCGIPLVTDAVRYSVDSNTNRLTIFFDTKD